MADKAKLKAAGCPDDCVDACAAMGMTADQVKALTAAGIDWSKLIAALPQIIALVLSIFGKVP